MIYGITYSDDKMTISAEKCRLSMLKHGIGEAIAYSPSNIDQFFYKNNREILSAERGCGYWIWKAYFINHRMSSLNDGDILIYSDAGVEFVNNVHHIIDRMDEDVFFFTNGWPNLEWCKGDVLRSILPDWWVDENDEFVPHIDYKQVQASVIFFKVNQKTKDFAKEWLLYCQMPGFIDDSPSKLPNYPTFADHRHDQAILTCLQIKYGYKLHFWSTSYSDHIRHTAQPTDDYPVLFNHHRKRNNEW